MTEHFRAASEAVERMCATGWRFKIGRRDETVIPRVRSTLFDFSEGESGWRFSFPARLGREWVAGEHVCEPPDLDPLSGKSVGMTQFCSGAADAVLDDLAEKLAERGDWYGR